MDKDLMTRFVLVVVIVAAYLVVSRAEFHNAILAPLAVVAVAAVMFYPRRSEQADGKQAGRVSTREAQRELRENVGH